MSDEREMPNQAENIFMQDLMVLRNDLVKYSDKVHARLAPFPGAWRDLRLMLHLVRKFQAQLLDTIPEKKVAQLHNIAMHGNSSSSCRARCGKTALCASTKTAWRC